MQHKKINDIINAQEENFKASSKDKKAKKILGVLISIIVIELLAVVGLTLFVIFMPKNNCIIKTNLESAIVYVDDEQTNEFRLSKPGKDFKESHYQTSISLKLPEGSTYNVEFTIKCDYKVEILTPANMSANKYTLQIEGGNKTEIISQIGVSSKYGIDKFEIEIDIKITEV